MAVDESRDPAGEIAALAPGTVFHGVYEVVRCLKAGGMGAVYEVLQTSTQRYRALKVMLPSLVTDPEMRARFELEAKIAAGIESEHIVETMDAGIDQATGMPFIVMELLKGQELGALLKERKRLSPDDVVTYLHQAALALDRTHAAGIIHRDLKPENLFLTRRDDGSPRVKILDFGVAKIVADGSVNANSTKTVGSPLYMGPEQISGDLKIGPAVDRYSLAHIAFTLLVGKPYWHVERKSVSGIYPFMMLIIKGATVTASARAAEYGVRLPEAFDPWFVKATSIDPAERHASAVGMIAELGRIFGIASSTSAAVQPSEMLPSAPEPRRTAASIPTVVEKEKPKAAPAIVRSDEPSLLPVSVAKPQRSWFVPVSLLAIGVSVVVAAIALWPRQTSSQVQAESGRAPAAAASSTSPVVVVPLPSPTPVAVVPSASASVAMVPQKSAAAVSSAPAVPGASSSPKPTGSATSKPTPPKGNDVLDQY